MKNLYGSKDFHWALFLGHLVIERFLKARIVDITANHPFFSHDLRKLAKIADLELTDMQREQMDTITTFNLNARYDDYKQLFYQKCTLNYTKYWINNIEKLSQWISQKL